MCSFQPYSVVCVSFFFSLPSLTWLAVSLADRNCRVRDLSCSRRQWRLIRLPASPVAPDGATAGWMDMITHSQTGLTPPTASVFAVLFLISFSWPLSVFSLQIVSIPQCSCPCHSGVKSRQSRQSPNFLRLLFTEQAFTAGRAMLLKYSSDYYNCIKWYWVIVTVWKGWNHSKFARKQKNEERENYL